MLNKTYHPADTSTARKAYDHEQTRIADVMNDLLIEFSRRWSEDKPTWSKRAELQKARTELEELRDWLTGQGECAP